MSSLINLTYDFREVEVVPHRFKGVLRATAQTEQRSLSGICFGFVRLAMGYAQLDSTPYFMGDRGELSVLYGRKASVAERFGKYRGGRGLYLIPAEVFSLPEQAKPLLGVIGERLQETFALFKESRRETGTRVVEANNGFFPLDKFILPVGERSGYWGFSRVITTASDRTHGPSYI